MGGGLVGIVSEARETVLTIISHIAHIRDTECGMKPFELKSQIHLQVWALTFSLLQTISIPWGCWD